MGGKRILIRIDDVCPTMNRSNFDYAIRRLKECGKTALLGVVPNCKDNELKIESDDNLFWQKMSLLQEDGFCIAMHGYEHVFDIEAPGLVNNGFKSEFAGHPYGVQFDKIRMGKLLLEKNGIHTDVFFAPAHSYDNTTLKALSANGFKYVSDGKSSKPYLKYGIKCIPCRSGGISSMRFGNYHVAVIHTHEWGKRGNIERDKFNRLIQERADCIAGFEEFTSLKAGWLPWQLLIEKSYLLYERIIKPRLSKIVKGVR